jgi:hypothetical protein
MEPIRRIQKKLELGLKWRLVAKSALEFKLEIIKEIISRLLPTKLL